MNALETRFSALSGLFPDIIAVILAFLALYKQKKSPLSDQLSG